MASRSNCIPGSRVCCYLSRHQSPSLGIISGVRTGKGTGLPFPSSRGFNSSCHLSWPPVHTWALRCFPTQTKWLPGPLRVPGALPGLRLNQQRQSQTRSQENDVLLNTALSGLAALLETMLIIYPRAGSPCLCSTSCQPPPGVSQRGGGMVVLHPDPL